MATRHAHSRGKGHHSKKFLAQRRFVQDEASKRPGPVHTYIASCKQYLKPCRPNSHRADTAAAAALHSLATRRLAGMHTAAEKGTTA